MANTNSLDLEKDSTQYASIADASQTGLDLSTTFTIEAWVKLETLATVSALIAGKQDDSHISKWAYEVFIDATDGLVKALVSDGTGYDFYKSFSVSTGTWTHIAVTCNVGNASATTFEFFKDGVSQGNGTSIISGNISAIQNVATDFVIGARQTNGTKDEFLDGLIDEVRVWNDVRTVTEIANNKDSELVGNEANLVAYWKLNNDYLDQTTNNNDLTSSGSPVFSVDVPFIGSSTYTSPLPAFRRP